MPVTDPVADMLTRIRNGIQARHDSVLVPHSKLKLSIAQILKEQGYIRDFDIPRGKRFPTSVCTSLTATAGSRSSAD